MVKCAYGKQMKSVWQNEILNMKFNPIDILTLYRLRMKFNV